jgi:hypothetical protein
MSHRLLPLGRVQKIKILEMANVLMQFVNEEKIMLGDSIKQDIEILWKYFFAQSLLQRKL